MRLVPIAAAAALLASVATPAFAQDTAASNSFTGPRVGVTVGTGGNKFVDFDGQTIGIDAGYDIDIGNGGVIGLGAEYQTDLGDDFLDINETALLGRIGGKAGNNALVYVTGGYVYVGNGATPFDDGNDGYRVGLGAEFGLGAGPAVKVEQRYFNYGNGADGWQTVAGVGVRF